jgi:hypothetical protein
MSDSKKDPLDYVPGTPEEMEKVQKNVREFVEKDREASRPAKKSPQPHSPAPKPGQ